MIGPVAGTTTLVTVDFHEGGSAQPAAGFEEPGALARRAVIPAEGEGVYPGDGAQAACARTFAMRLTVVGCGDAFGSGGRLQTCYHVEAAGTRFLIDCGATALIGLDRVGIDPNAIPTIFVSHLHGDHFGGLVWWLIHAQHVAKRAVPLTVVGPVGVEARFKAAAEALFPGSTGVPRRYDLTFLELERERPLDVGPVQVTPFEVKHPSGAPSYALRFEVEGKVLSFTGDSEWVESLVPAGRGADLYIMECYWFEGEPRFHTSWSTIQANLDRIGAKRVLLTHMAAPMLARRGEVADPRVVLAEDGLVLDL
jgi:ribonuclease BN (tRNA processing enzyme)